MKTVRRLRQRNNPRAGFSLTELGMVMAIIGLIIGGIWAAVSSVLEAERIDKASTELNQIATNIRAFYSGQNVTFANQNAHYAPGLSANPLPTPAPSFGPAGQDFCYFTQQMVSQGIFPAGILGAGTILEDPWFMTGYICSSGEVGSIQTALAGTAANGVDFIIRFRGVPFNDCMQFLMRNAIPGPESKLVDILLNWPTGATTTYQYGYTGACTVGGTCSLPPSIADATIGCNEGNSSIPYTFDFRYHLGN